MHTRPSIAWDCPDAVSEIRLAALAKIHRLLKPGGQFISSTVCLAHSVWFLRPVIPVLQWIGKAPYVSFVGENNVLREVAAVGFEAREHWTHGGRVNSLFLMASKVLTTF